MLLPIPPEEEQPAHVRESHERWERMGQERLCAQCGERPAARGRTRCWRCINAERPAKPPRDDSHAPGWERVPYGTRLTLSEVAQITGLRRESIARYVYPSVQAQGKRHLPRGFKILRIEPKIIFLIRENSH